MEKMRFEARMTFEADGLEDAMQKLAEHFSAAALEAGGADEVAGRLDYLGSVKLAPDDDAEVWGA